ncbi:hypothetical protein J6590_061671 [Homalodisca vitripennis]|nr:hypothetical protein J6590_061671 [Homalodisca vitripennis]
MASRNLSSNNNVSQDQAIQPLGAVTAAAASLKSRILDLCKILKMRRGSPSTS